jgi:hypothetical protein
MMQSSRRLYGACAIGAALLLALPCAGLTGEREDSGIELDVTVETLGNGLKIILLEDHSVPVISYQTFFRVQE